MSGSLREDSRGKRRIFVHDASGIFAGVPLSLPGKHYTTPKIIEEIRDEYSKRILELALVSNKLEVVGPPKKAVEEVAKKAGEIGELNRLSGADISVLALAYWFKRKGYEVILVSDDYSVQNTALYLNLVFMAVKTIGIKEMRKYEVYCPNCGWRGVTNSTTCPRCGFPLARRIRH